jgi:hypothetical protein
MALTGHRRLDDELAADLARIIDTLSLSLLYL